MLMGRDKIKIIIACLISLAVGKYHSINKTWGKLNVTEQGIVADCTSGSLSLPDTYSYLQVVDCSLPILSLNGFSQDCKGLYLSDKNIQEIGRFFGFFYKLIELDLSHNNISELRSGIFGYLSRLKHLDLSYNNIKFISADTFGNIGLYTIYLQNNKISHISNHFQSQAYSIKEIDISSNSLTEIGVAFKDLKQLTHLYIDYNNISSILPDAFRGSSSLLFLDISHNNLRYFPYGAFSQLDNLRYLNYSDNNFQDFPFHISFYLKDLYEMNFRNNNLSLDAKLFVQRFPNVHIVDIRGTNNSCEQLINIVEELEKEGIDFYKADAFNEDNVRGIPCHNENLKRGLKTNAFVTETVTKHGPVGLRESAVIFPEKINHTGSTEINTNETLVTIFVIIVLLLLVIAALLAVLLYFSIKSNRDMSRKQTLLGLK